MIPIRVVFPGLVLIVALVMCVTTFIPLYLSGNETGREFSSLVSAEVTVRVALETWTFFSPYHQMVAGVASLARFDQINSIELELVDNTTETDLIPKVCDAYRKVNTPTYLGLTTGVWIQCLSYQPGIYKVQARHIDYVNEYTLDENFTFIGANYDVPRLSPYDPRLRPWFGQLKTSNGFTKVYLNFSSTGKGASCTTVGGPIYMTNGSLLGVMASDVFPTDVVEYFSGVQVARTGHALLVEEDSYHVLGADFAIPSLGSDLIPLQNVTEGFLSAEAKSAALAAMNCTLSLTSPQCSVVYGSGRQKGKAEARRPDPTGVLPFRVVLLIPESDFLGTLWARTDLTIAVVVPVLVVVLIIAVVAAVLQVLESERRGASHSAGNKMTLQILEHQRRYNTEQVSELLSECTKAAVVDPELISLFKEMNANMESYRPFLPNYLFQEEEEEEENVAKAGSEVSGSRISSVDLSAPAPGPSAQAPVSVLIDVQSVKSIGSAESNPLAPPAQHAQQHPHAQQHQAMLRRLDTPLYRPVVVSERCVTFALVDIQMKRWVSLARTSGVALTSVVNTVYKMANETKASVHSMLGDTVQLTWNATHSIALAEAKGALFLSGLKKGLTERSAAADGIEIETPPSLVVAGTVCSGMATVHSITSATHQLAMIVEASWFPALHGCFDLAKRHGTLLMDERTACGANLSIESCAVEKLHYLPTSAGAAMTTDPGALPQAYSFLYHHPLHGEEETQAEGSQSFSLVYQILDEKERDEGLEWMYQLDAAETTNDTSVPGTTQRTVAQWQLEALTAIEAGQYTEAKMALENSTEQNRSEVSAEKGKKNPTNLQPMSSFKAVLHSHCEGREDAVVVTSLETVAGP